jgi:hypothetical protein
MAFRIDDPFFDQPALDFLNPVTPWVERDQNDARVDIAVIYAQHQPSPFGGKVVRAEITASPAYVKAHFGRMLAEVGPAIVELVAGGHEVFVKRFVVRAGVLDLVCIEDSENDEP